MKTERAIPFCHQLREEETMGEGEETKTRPDPEEGIQERGDIFFFYRPKVNREEAHDPDDVQRLYIVLRPQSSEPAVEKDGDGEAVEEGEGKEGVPGGEKANAGEVELLHRFIVMGRKSLPDPSQRGSPYWGFVEMVTKDPEDLKTALRGEEYETATRGRRHKPPARALAEGVYRILRHKARSKAHTHLVYKLEFPREGGEPQASLNVEREGSFVIQVKNPDKGGGGGRFRGLQGKRKAAFPARLQGLLGGLRFSPADPPEFLNYEGCELLLISASDDIDEELGLELKTEEGEQGGRLCSDLIQSLGDGAASPKPLLSGAWA